MTSEPYVIPQHRPSCVDKVPAVPVSQGVKDKEHTIEEMKDEKLPSSAETSENDRSVKEDQAEVEREEESEETEMDSRKSEVNEANGQKGQLEENEKNDKDKVEEEMEERVEMEEREVVIGEEEIVCTNLESELPGSTVPDPDLASTNLDGVDGSNDCRFGESVGEAEESNVDTSDEEHIQPCAFTEEKLVSVPEEPEMDENKDLKDEIKEEVEKENEEVLEKEKVETKNGEGEHEVKKMEENQQQKELNSQICEIKMDNRERSSSMKGEESKEKKAELKGTSSYDHPESGVHGCEDAKREGGSDDHPKSKKRTGTIGSSDSEQECSSSSSSARGRSKKGSRRSHQKEEKVKEEGRKHHEKAKTSRESVTQGNSKKESQQQGEDAKKRRSKVGPVWEEKEVVAAVAVSNNSEESGKGGGEGNFSSSGQMMYSPSSVGPKGVLERWKAIEKESQHLNNNNKNNNKNKPLNVKNRASIFETNHSTTTKDTLKRDPTPETAEHKTTTKAVKIRVESSTNRPGAVPFNSAFSLVSSSS